MREDNMTTNQVSSWEIARDLTTKLLEIKADALYPTACHEILEQALDAERATQEELRGEVERLMKQVIYYKIASEGFNREIQQMRGEKP